MAEQSQLGRVQGSRAERRSLEGGSTLVERRTPECQEEEEERSLEVVEERL